MSIFKIKAIRKCINHNACILLIHSLVFLSIDYANYLYSNLPNYRINKLNMIIRSSVRIINNLNIYCHASISKIRHSLKILDAYKRSFLKSLLLVHNIIYSNHTSNLSRLIKYYFAHSSLRSAKSVKLNLPKYKYKLLLGRSFRITAPLNWNLLPNKLRCISNVISFRAKVNVTCSHYTFNSVPTPLRLLFYNLRFLNN